MQIAGDPCWIGAFAEGGPEGQGGERGGGGVVALSVGGDILVGDRAGGGAIPVRITKPSKDTRLPETHRHTSKLYVVHIPPFQNCLACCLTASCSRLWHRIGFGHGNSFHASSPPPPILPLIAPSGTPVPTHVVNSAGSKT